MVFSENIIRQNIAQEKKPPMLPAEEYLAQNIPGDSRNFSRNILDHYMYIIELRSVDDKTYLPSTG